MLNIVMITYRSRVVSSLQCVYTDLRAKLIVIMAFALTC